MNKLKDVGDYSIEQIIKLPYFHSLERIMPNAKEGEITPMWRISFRCNKTTPDGRWQLLDEVSDNEYLIRYKLIDVNF